MKFSTFRKKNRVASCHFWCFNIRSDVLREISDVWCFGNKSDVYWAIIFFSKFLYFLDENELASKFLSFFNQFLTLMCVWYFFQTEEALFIALGITFTLCINDKLFHLMTILLCFGFIVGQGRTQGRVLGLNSFLNLIFYENFITCAKEINCFRIPFAC